MKKVLLSAFVCVALSATMSARNDVKEVKKEKEAVVAPCGGYIIVRDSKGSIVHSEVYVSNGPTKQDCSDGFLKQLESVLALYPSTSYKYETDVNWTGA